MFSKKLENFVSAENSVSVVYDSKIVCIERKNHVFVWKRVFQKLFCIEFKVAVCRKPCYVVVFNHVAFFMQNQQKKSYYEAN